MSLTDQRMWVTVRLWGLGQMGGFIKLKYSRLFLFYYSYWLLNAQPGGYNDSQSDHISDMQKVFSVWVRQFYFNTTRIFWLAALDAQIKISLCHYLRRSHFNISIYLICSTFCMTEQLSILNVFIWTFCCIMYDVDRCSLESWGLCLMVVFLRM